MNLKMNLFLASVLTAYLPTLALAEPTSSYVVKGGVCMDGSWFNAAESVPVGAILFAGSEEEVRAAVQKSEGAAFFFRGDERNIFIHFKSGKDFEYRSRRAPCPNEGWSLISLERVVR